MVTSPGGHRGLAFGLAGSAQISARVAEGRAAWHFPDFSSGDNCNMTHAFQSLLCLLVQFFAPRHNAQIRFLKAQIRILRRRLPKEHIVPDPEEKAELLRIGSEIGMM